MTEPQSAESTGAKPRMGGHSVRRICRIARQLGARSYLEIGVSRGKTFNSLQFERKVAVDPRFRFEVADFQREGVEFHEMPSDVYFTSHGASERFDVIFLDGLHTFQQTFRDFCNSLACSHDRTVWLIDDVLPVDVYSALPVESEALKNRKRAGGDGPQWHGDVYKLVFVLHDFFPMFSYVTITGSGNPQTLLWKVPRNGFSPLLNSMEAIERLSYFDLLKRMEVLNAKTEEAAFRDLIASFSELDRAPHNPSGRERRWMRRWIHK
jgi:hypothetical protein